MRNNKKPTPIPTKSPQPTTVEISYGIIPDIDKHMRAIRSTIVEILYGLTPYS